MTSDPKRFCFCRTRGHFTMMLGSLIFCLTFYSFRPGFSVYELLPLPIPPFHVHCFFISIGRMKPALSIPFFMGISFQLCIGITSLFVTIWYHRPGISSIGRIHENRNLLSCERENSLSLLKNELTFTEGLCYDKSVGGVAKCNTPLSYAASLPSALSCFGGFSCCRSSMAACSWMSS